VRYTHCRKCYQHLEGVDMIDGLCGYGCTLRCWLWARNKYAVLGNSLWARNKYAVLGNSLSGHFNTGTQLACSNEWQIAIDEWLALSDEEQNGSRYLMRSRMYTHCKRCYTPLRQEWDHQDGLCSGYGGCTESCTTWAFCKLNPLTPGFKYDSVEWQVTIDEWLMYLAERKS
jgi:ferredoxin